MSSQPLSFLVVEDDGGVRRTIARALAAYGHVESVGTCAAGRMALRARRFDALVIDVNLPDGSGLELVELARARLPGACLLVLTGSTEHAIISAAHQGGARFLLKPCNAEHLEVLAAEALARKDARGRRTKLALERWRDDYGLTKTEVELLALGVDGVRREDFSQIRGVRPDTIRKQIQMLLHKTGDETFESAVNSLLREALAEPT